MFVDVVAEAVRPLQHGALGLVVLVAYCLARR